MAKSTMSGPEHRGEFARETGFGRITKLEPKGRNTQLTIDAEHLREPVTGWADATDTALMGHIGPAHAEARRIAYVIDTHRKADVDDDILITDLTPRQKVRAVMSIVAVDANGSPLDGSAPPAAAPSSPPAQPSTSTSPAVSHETPAPSSSPAATEEERPPTATERLGIRPGQNCPRCGKPRGGVMVKNPDGPGLIHQDCPAATEEELADQAAHAAEAAAVDDVPPIGANPDAVTGETLEYEQAVDDEAPPADDPSQPTPRAPLAAPSTHPARRARQAEDRPWVAFDGAGRVNLGSYAYQAAVGAITLAGELTVAKARAEFEEHGTPIPPPDPKVIKFLANRILEAADRAQAAVRPDGRPNRMDNSHTRARGAIRLALDLYPVPWGAEPDVRAAWVDNLAAFATMVLELGRDVTLAGEED